MDRFCSALLLGATLLNAADIQVAQEPVQGIPKGIPLAQHPVQGIPLAQDPVVQRFPFWNSPGASPSPGATACQIAAANPHTFGIFTPQCTADGAYNPRQCLNTSFWDVCWCVNVNGTKIPGTERIGDLAPVNCSALTPCQAAASAALPQKWGKYMPQCGLDGGYEPRQTGPFGEHWCVTEDGTEIPGTRTPPGAKPQRCEEQTASPSPGATPCQIAAAAHHDFGEYVPQCTDDGAYAPQQCAGVSFFKTCWCVNQNGTEIPQTRRFGNMNAVNCSALTACQAAAAAALPVVPGKYMPQCDLNGAFIPSQFSPTGEHWCVFQNGAEVPGTRTRPGTRPQHCEKLTNVQLIVKPLDTGAVPTYTIALSPTVPLGQSDSIAIYASVPVFQENASGIIPVYSAGAEVCNGSTFSTLPSGAFASLSLGAPCSVAADSVISFTVPAAYLKPNPAQTTVTVGIYNSQDTAITYFNYTTGTPCQIAAAGEHSFGEHVPQCTADGAYAPKQCLGLLPAWDICWCVDQNGTEIKGTKRVGNILPLNCSALTPCQLAQGAADADDDDTPDQFVPHCQADGSYTPVQCFGGECWCVDVDGVEVAGTRRRPGVRRMQCPAPSPSPSP